MEKKTYYVSVQAGTVMENQGDAAYELEIRATPEQIGQLKSLFEDMGDYDHDAFLKAHRYTFPYNLDAENDGYDYYLRDVYQLLYDLGTSETRRHIRDAGLFAAMEPNNG
jgi:hypothetical protein